MTMADLSTGESLSDTSFRTEDAAQEAEESIRSMYMERRAAANLSVVLCTIAGYRQVVDGSSLKSPVKRTLHVMVDNSVGNQTTIDRASLCLLTGKRDVSTLIDHWNRARAAGLLEGQPRFDNSSIHTFLIPGTNASAGTPVNWHSWTADEIAWWDSLDPEHWTLLHGIPGRARSRPSKNPTLNKESYSRKACELYGRPVASGRCGQVRPDAKIFRDE